MKKLRAQLKSVGYFFLGLVILPFFIIAHFPRIIGGLKGLFTGLDFISLNEKEHRPRLKVRTLSTTPSLTTHEELGKEICELIDADRWLDVSEKIRAWDQARETCEAGLPMASSARDVILRHLAEGAYQGNACHPEPFFAFSDATVEKLETLAAVHSDSYPLLALAAEMRCHQGWLSRGADYAQYVSDEGWHGMQANFAKAALLVDRFDPVAIDAPLLAAARHKLLAFMPDAEKHVFQYYEEWSALNPKDQLPHKQHALMMLPRWFGSAEQLQVEAQKAAIRTADVTGDAAYFSMFALALNNWDPNVLDIDLDAFRRGAHDVFSLRSNDPAYVAHVLQDMSWWSASGAESGYAKHQRPRIKEIMSALAELRIELMKTRLTAIHGLSWDGSVRAAIEELSVIFQKEIKEGATFEVGENGVTVIPATGAPEAVQA